MARVMATTTAKIESMTAGRGRDRIDLFQRRSKPATAPHERPEFLMATIPF
jgi:hypothetical protein